MNAGDLKRDFFPKVLVFSDGKFRGSHREFKGGKELLSAWGGLFPFQQIKRFSDDHMTLYVAVYVDMSGYPYMEKHVRSPELPDWLPEDMRHAS